MIDKYSLEFSKLYSRLMRLELQMKHNAIFAIENYYEANSLNTFYRFFIHKNRIQRYAKYKGNILISIGKLRPDLIDTHVKNDEEMEYNYNKHRVLLELCDEIALYNGYNINELPSPWSILREMYRVKKELVLEIKN